MPEAYVCSRNYEPFHAFYDPSYHLCFIHHREGTPAGQVGGLLGTMGSHTRTCPGYLGHLLPFDNLLVIFLSGSATDRSDPSPGIQCPRVGESELKL